MKIVFLLFIALAFIALLILGQQRMIYYPRSYSEDLNLPNNCRTIHSTTSQGKQQAYYLWIAGKGDNAPDRLWVLYGGNAALALDWLELLDGYPDPGAGFLLLDYPGYGNSQGRVSPKAILESTESVLTELADVINIDTRKLEQRLHVMGHSLGAAAVLLYASHHPVQKIVLVSPFTSLEDMATLVVGWPLNKTLLHDYDNRARLQEITTRDPQVPISIIHGDHDKIVPVKMGRELAKLFPTLNYLEIPKGDHNYILVTAKAEIIEAMTGQDISERPVKE